jgi:tRNA/rRNA methyltransferase
MISKINLDNISIVLNRPRYPENIGAAARAIRNMGIGSLIVVDPRTYDVEKILKLATHESRKIVEAIRIFPNLPAALKLFSYVVGTTARMGNRRHAMNSPEKMSQKLIPISYENRIAIVFGPEDRGLTNEDIRNCHLLVNIPTAQFSSLNLAQSVMVICYELHKASMEEPEKHFVPRLANRHELDGMYSQMKEILIKISFINPDNPEYWLDNFRRFFSRLPLRAKEVSLIRGICRQINWYGKYCYEQGLKVRKRISVADTSKD